MKTSPSGNLFMRKH